MRNAIPEVLFVDAMTLFIIDDLLNTTDILLHISIYIQVR